ncbi:MAG: Ig-like domain-containing protein, partial [Mariprofundales bacterium]
IMTSYAGSGNAGFAGDNGLATTASLFFPRGLALDVYGNLYIADMLNQRIRKVDAQTKIITTVAGNGSLAYSGDGSTAIAASLQYPYNLALDQLGNLYVADSGNNAIRKVDAQTNIITTIAGNGTSGYAGDTGLATSAALSSPQGITIDEYGNIYIADTGNVKVRMVDAITGIITTVAGNGIQDGYGNGTFSGDGKLATLAGIKSPYDVAIDHLGNVYIADFWNNRIRQLNTNTGIITTVAGNGMVDAYGTGVNFGDGNSAIISGVASPSNIAVDNIGNVYMITGNPSQNRVKKLTFPDTTAPIITAPADATGTTTTIVIYTATATAIDAVDIAPVITSNAPATFPVGTTIVTWTATDAAGNVSTATQNVVVINTPPTFTFPAISPYSISGLQDQPISLTVVASDVDGDLLSYSILMPASQGVAFVDSATGAVIYQPSTGFSGNDSFEIAVADGRGGTAIRTINVNVIPLFANAVVTPIDGYTNSLFSFSLNVDETLPLRNVTVTVVDISTNRGIVDKPLMANANTYSVDIGNLGIGNYEYSFKINHQNGAIKLWPSDGTKVLGPIVSTLSTSITDNAVSNNITIGDNISVSGSIAPLGMGLPIIQATFTSPAGDTIVNGTADVNGNFTITRIADITGTWTVQTRYQGNNIYAPTTGLLHAVTVQSATTSLSLNSNTTGAMLGDKVQLSGKFTVQTLSALSLANLTGAQILITDPYGNQTALPLVLNSTGNFSKNIPLSLEGSWLVQADFAGNGNYLASNSATITINVMRSAGYALIVEGRVEGNNSLAAHNMTTSTIYKRMLNRGIPQQNIRYFSYWQDGNGQAMPPVPSIEVYAQPTQAAIQDSIENWAANQMIASPAPLFVVFVNHGSPDAFHIFQNRMVAAEQNVIAPNELNTWLTTLDNKLALSATDRTISPSIFVDGNCYSGSFIPTLSAVNRVIITSAAANELSQQGAYDPNKRIRDGELFVSELFKHLGMGDTLASAFEQAAILTEDLSKNTLPYTGVSLF